MVGAARAAMRRAWLRRERKWPADLAGVTPDHTLDALVDLLPLLEPARP